MRRQERKSLLGGSRVRLRKTRRKRASYSHGPFPIGTYFDVGPSQIYLTSKIYLFHRWQRIGSTYMRSQNVCLQITQGKEVLKMAIRKYWDHRIIY